VSELGGGLQATQLHVGATRPVGRTVLVLSRIAGISPHDISAPRVREIMGV
jgi:hypothetical protein